MAVAQAEQVPSASICIPTPHRSDCWANTLIEILGQMEKTNKQKNHHHALLLVYLGLGLDRYPCLLEKLPRKPAPVIGILLRLLRVKFNNGNIFEKTGLNETGWDLRNPGNGVLKGHGY